MESYETGYEDELFQYPVSQTFHCGICYNVMKHPVMCRRNEHLFCRACITRHLANSRTCPVCMEQLTVNTLTHASRTLTNLLSELKIRCEFFNRGCEMFVELGDLERHVAECAFSPVVCANKGCGLEVNRQDLMHHDGGACEKRRIKCHNCSGISRGMDVVKNNLAAMNVKLNEVGEKLKRSERNIKAVEENVLAKVELVHKQLNKQEESNQELKADNIEIKKTLNQLSQQLEFLTEQTLHVVLAGREGVKKGFAKAGRTEREAKIVVAGGKNSECLNSVEMFDPSTATWTLLQPMKECRQVASSVVYNNQIFVIGGFLGSGSKAIEKISTNAVHVDQSITWEIVPAELSSSLYGHSSFVYNGRLIVIGGYDCSVGAYSNKITEVSLVPPYTRRELATMPQPRWSHCASLFGDKIVILGGRKDMNYRKTFESVLLYDIERCECQELAPLPYPVSDMAAVKRGDDNVILLGGVDTDGEPMDRVLIYNVTTQKSHMLPNMKYKRKGCAAATIEDTVFVIGGEDDGGNELNSAESFKFDSFTWEELPTMHEARWGATAVVC
ncbi:influenza virus NS1A-binding protein-like [Dendronephthya gigantea]|uniref:influenza virus NS1A-binding protein-like n=1 Tax=Dendronephthya gigantea TaxID=151771 RepID=UPI00106DBBDA|nr:influenza virus NS1A-binding protein-like [Dendronephthya gigantea]